MIEEYKNLRGFKDHAADLISNGSKTLVVKPGHFDIIGEHFVLLDNRRAYGVITFGDVKRVPRGRLRKTSAKHLVNSTELENWGWSMEPIFFLYSFNFEPFDKPLATRIPRGSRTLVRKIEYVVPSEHEGSYLSKIPTAVAGRPIPPVTPDSKKIPINKPMSAPSRVFRTDFVIKRCDVRRDSSYHVIIKMPTKILDFKMDDCPISNDNIHMTKLHVPPVFMHTTGSLGVGHALNDSDGVVMRLTDIDSGVVGMDIGDVLSGRFDGKYMKGDYIMKQLRGDQYIILRGENNE